MNIKRLNSDFGNSTNNFTFEGYYFEIPTNVVEISAKKASEVFVSPIKEPKELLSRLMISTEVNGEEKYYLVGEMAELSKLSHNHVNRMHNKIKSIVPYVSFLSAVAYYYSLDNVNSKDINDESEPNTIDIEYMSMMLPIWLLKKEGKFSDATKQMEERFIGEHKFKLKTLGMEKELKVIVKNAKCRIESEVSRHAIKYKMVAGEKDNSVLIEKRNEVISKFQHPTVLVDIGGGSTDAVELGAGLTAPQSKESFQVIDIKPFLGVMEQLRKEKLLEYFDDLRALEKFIIENYKTHKYVLKNENTGESFDFTEQITEMLDDYSDVLITKVLEAFKINGDEVIKFIYFGGEAPVLESFIRKNLLKHMNEQSAENNHFFLNDILEDDKKEIFKPTSRTINLSALELLSIDETKNV